MTVLTRIDKPGKYKDIKLMGKDRNKDIGLVIDVWGNKPVEINAIEICNTFVPIIIQGNAPVYVTDSLVYLFGGDGMNIRGSNVHFINNNIEGNTPTRPYFKIEVKPGYTIEKALYEAEVSVYDPRLLQTYVDKNDGKVYIEYYHQDAIQMYGTAKGKYHSTTDDILENVTMENVSIHMTGDTNQSISLTERCGYNEIHIGTSNLSVYTDHYYSLMATNLNNFTIGNMSSVNVNKPVRLEQPKGKESPYYFYTGKVMLPGKQIIAKDAEDIHHITPTAFA